MWGGPGWSNERGFTNGIGERDTIMKEQGSFTPERKKLDNIVVYKKDSFQCFK